MFKYHTFTLIWLQEWTMCDVNWWNQVRGKVVLFENQWLKYQWSKTQHIYIDLVPLFPWFDCMNQHVYISILGTFRDMTSEREESQKEWCWGKVYDFIRFVVHFNGVLWNTNYEVNPIEKCCFLKIDPKQAISKTSFCTWEPHLSIW